MAHKMEFSEPSRHFGTRMQPVLILGAGINGAALARELVLNGTPVWVVDTADLASGATAYSSRLIHGGLRYLEYGELDLVRESLAERTRLLRLAPQYVRPLRLFIPVRRRWSGLWSAARRFFRLGAPAATGPGDGRGLWLVRTGLWMYDRFARDPLLPERSVYRADDPRAPPVDLRSFRWACAYSDAAIQFPERFVVALLQDARQEAARQGIDFRVLTYHRAALASPSPAWGEGRADSATFAPSPPWGEGLGEGPAARAVVEISPIRDTTSRGERLRLAPSAIVNATGAWGDHTLRSLHLESRQLIGGTKGSHFVTSHAGLRAALAGRGIYAEAADGRPVFLLPLGENSLVGTTDIPFSGDPAAAVATEEELAYLLAAASAVFPELRLTRRDIDWHYCGVRPLPHVDAATPAAVTRRHWLEENKQCPVPLYSVIGGKLTTCRSLAEEAAGVILRRLGRATIATSRDRPIPGGEGYPMGDEVGNKAARTEHARFADRLHLPPPIVALAWQLWGTSAERVLEACDNASDVVEGTMIPTALVRWIIEHEWPRRLDDLVCRRLMLLHARHLRRVTLAHLAELLAERDLAAHVSSAEEVDRTVEILARRYGKRVMD